MPVSAETLRKLMDAGLSGETLLGIVASIDADAGSAPKVRTVQALRQERYRIRKASQNVTSDASRDGSAPIPLSLDKENPLASPKEIKPKTPLPPNSPAFEAFWGLFPNKVGKTDASRALSKALLIADLETIMAGLRRYVAKTDDRPWCNPATFLNQGRWNDEPAAVPRNRNGPQTGSKPGSINELIDRRREQRNADELEARISGGGAVLQLSDFSSG